MDNDALRIYIAGPYRATTPEEVDANIRVARDAMAELLRMGHIPFCPHSMTAAFERDYPDIPDQAYLQTDLDWLRVCHAILLLPRWDKSAGTTAEVDEAERRGLIVYMSLAEVPPVRADLRMW